MPLYVKNKNRKTVLTSLILALTLTMGMLTLGWFELRPVFAQSATDSIGQISLSASLFDNESRIIPNGTHEVRFGIYNKNRDVADAFPSNTDASNRLWEETQTVTVKNGIFRAFLGSVTPLPSTLNFESGNYYIGIRIGTDSEMVPRKQLGSVPRAINSQFLQGKSVGIKEGDIAAFGKQGKLNIKNLPTGTKSNQLVLGDDSRFDDVHTQNTDLGTTSEIFNVGSGTTLSGTNFDLTVSSSAIPPALRFNGTTQVWQFSNDGATFSDISSGTGNVMGTGVAGSIAYWTGASTLGSETELAISRGGTGANTLADLITLGTHTTGNYVAGITSGNGISGTSATEGGTPTIAIDLLDSLDGTGSVSSFSGLEFSGAGSNELGLLQGCANGQGVSWNDATNVWECTSFSTGLAGTGTAGYATYWSGTAALGSEAQLNVIRGGTGVDASSAANGSLLIGNGSGFSLSTIASSNGLDVASGSGTIALSLDVTTTGTTPTTSSNSGLEATASGLRLLGGCTNDQVLAWNSASSIWVCSNKSGGTSDWTSTGSITYLSDVTDGLAIGGSTSNSSKFFFDVSTGNQIIFEGTGADDASETTFIITNPTADRSITFPDASGTVALTSDLHSAVTLSGENYLSIAGQVITAAAVDLSGSNVTGTLAAARLGALTGDVTSSGYATTIANSAVTYAKIQNVTTQTLLGRYAGTTGTAQEITIGTGLTLNSGTGVLSASGSGGTVTTVSVVTANGISGSVANPTTTPAITLALGAITPTTVNGLTFVAASDGFTIAGGTTPRTLTVTGANASVSGTNTGNVTLSGENYLSIAGQVITAAAVDLSGSNVTGTLAAARLGALTGDVTSSGYATTIANSAVTYAKIQNVTTQTLLGRYAGTTGTAQEITIGTGLTLNSGTGVLSASGSGGTVTTVSVVTANGISGSVANPTTTPAITLALGAITPTTVNGLTFVSVADGFTVSGGTTPRTLTVTGANASVSGTNTGNVTLSGENYLSIAGQVITAAAVDLSGSNVTGTLPVTNGGTGATTFTSNGVLYGNTTGAIQASAAGTSAQFLVANVSGVPTFVTMSGDATITNAGVLTIGADKVALGTDTTGNYVASATASGGLTLTGTEGGSLGILLQPSTDALSSTTSSGSGLEILSTGLTLLQGCGNNEVLSWNETTDVWACASISGVGGTTGSGATNQVAYWTGTSTLAGENQLSSSRGGTGIDGSAAANGTLLIGNGSGYSLATLTQGAGMTITNGAGSISIASTLGASVDLTSEVTGTLPVANGGTGATSLTDLIALTTHTTGNYVASITNGSGITGGNGGSEGAALTLALGALTSDWNQTGAYTISLNNASAGLKMLENGGTPTLFGIFDVADLTSTDKTYTFPDASGTVALTSDLHSAVTLSGENYLSIAGQVITAAAVDLSGSNVTGTLAAARLGALTGDVTSSGYATTIANSAVTYAKIQNVTTQTLLGRYAGTTGTAQEITIGTGLTLNSGTGVLSASGSGGTVTTVSVVTANGISGSVANPTTTPAITLALGAITPTTVNGLTFVSVADGFTVSGGTTPRTLTVTGANASVSGTNTGNVTLSGENYLSIAGQVITAAAVDLSGSNVTGTLPVTNGGTGQTTYTNGQILIGNTTGNTLTKATLTGTSDQVIVTNGTGSITLSLPQSIATTSTPTFGNTTINGTISILEGGASPTYKTIFQGGDQAADITYSLPTATGSAGQVLKVDASSNLYWATVSGGSGGIGTVTSVGSGNGLTGGPITTTGTLSILLQPSTDALSSTTSSGSGLEAFSTGLTLLQGCSNNEVLSWNETTDVWACASISGVGGVTGSGSTNQVTYWSGTSTLAGENQLSVSRGGTSLDGSAAANGTLLIGNGSGYSLATLTGSNGLSIANGSGSITLSLDVTTTGTTATTSSNSGLETDASGLRLLGGCNNDQVLAWNNSSNIWVCSDKTGGTSNFTDAGTFTYLTAITDDVVFGGATADAGFFFDVSASTLAFEGSTADAFETTFGVIDPTSDQTITLPNASGTILLSGGTLLTLTGTSGSSQTISQGDTITIAAGTGITTTGGATDTVTIAATLGTSVDLTSEVTGTLPVTNGGTGATTFTSNGVLYGNTTGAIQASAAGTSAQFLVANVSGVPTFVTMSGDATITNAGVLTIGADKVALGTDTTGNYVASATASGGLTLTGTEGGSLGILLQPSTDALSSTTSSGSGLEILSTGLTLLQGCGNNEVLSWNETTDVWACASISGVGGTTGSGATNQVAYWTGTSTLAGENQLSSSRGGTGIDGSAAANGTLLIGNGSGYSLATLTQGAGMTITNGAGSISIASTLGASVDLTSEVTGTLPVANGGTGATSLTDLIALTTHTTGNYVASITNGSGITGGNGGSEGAALTLALGALTSDWNQTGAYTISLNNASAGLKMLENGGTPTLFGIFDVADLTSTDKTYTFPDASGTVALTSDLHSAVTLSGENYLSIAGQVITAAAVDLSGSNVTGTLPVTNGGTGATTFTSNGVLYGNTTGAIQASAAGTSAQFLVANVSGVPTFVTMSGDATITNAGVLTIGADKVALGTDTTGNYVASATASGGLTLTGTEGGSLGILLQPSTDALSSTTSSGSGLEILSTGLTLLQGCGNNEVLSWNETTDVWACASISGVGGTTGSGATNQVAYWTGTSTLAGENQLSSSRGGTGIDGSAAANGTLLIGNGSGYSLATLTQGAGMTITNGAGSISIASTLGASVDLTSEVTGTLPVANGGTGATSLTDLIALTTHTTGNYVASITNGSGITGGNGGSEGAALTLALGALTSDWNQTGAYTISLNNASAGLKMLENGGTPTLFGIFDVADLTSTDKTYTFPDASGTVALTSDLHSAVTLSGENYLSIAGQVITAAAVDLSGSNVTGTLPVTNGGTGATTFTSNGVLYGNTTGAIQASAAGTSAQFLVANVSGVPTFVTMSGDATITNAGVLTIGADKVALGTDTTGNYVASATASGGLTLTGTEGGSLGILLQPSTDALSSTTSSGSGLEILSTGLTLLQGCGNNEVLSWNETTDVWACASISGVGGTTGSGATNQVAYWTGTSTLAGENQLSSSRGGTGIDGSAAANGTLLIGNGSGYSLATLTQGAGMTITNGAGSISIASTLGASVDLTSEVTGTLPVANGGTGATSLTDLIALTTHTTGNYVASITNGSGITGGNGGSEGAALTLALGALTSDWNQTGAYTISLNNASAGLKMLENGGTPTLFGIFDVADLTSTDKTYTFPDASGTVALTSDLHSAVTVSGAYDYITLSGQDIVRGQIDLTTDVTGLLPAANGGTGLSGATAANGTLLIGNGSGYSLATLTQGAGMTITNGAGSISIASTLGASVDLTSEVTGTLPVANGGTGATSLNDLIALTTHTTGNYVASITNGSGITGGNGGSEGAALTLALGALTSDWNQTGAYTISLNNASAGLKMLENGGTPTLFGIFDVADLTSTDKTYTFPDASGTVALTSDLHSAVTVSGAYDYITLSGQDIVRGQIDLTTDVTGLLPAANGGTGLSGATAANGTLLIGNGSGYSLATLTQGAGMTITNGAGSISIASTLGASVDLTSEVTGTLPVANGGTNATSVGSAGSIAYSTGSAYAFSAVGTTGQALISGGTGAPTFFAPTAGSILFAGTSGILQQDNANFFWDDTNNRLGLGTTTPASMLSIYGTSNALRLSYDASNYNTFSTASDGTLNVTSSATTEAQVIIGNSTAQDTSIAFNSDTNDFYAGVDDATDKFMIGSGFIVGTTPYVTIDATGNLGIGDTTPASLFTVGSGDLFQVNSSGAIAAATGITSSGTITFSGLSTAGIVTNTSGGVLGTTTTVPVANGGTGIDGSSAANGTLLIGNGSGYTLATLTGSNGLSITNGGGSITLALDITTTGTTVTTSSNSGLETDASGLRLLGGCSNDQVLAWNSSSNIWVCSDKTGGTSNFTDAGAFTYLTSITDDVVFGGATTDAGFFFDVSASTLTFEGLTADAFETTFGVVDPTADRTLTFPDATGTVITTGNLTDITATGTIASGTWNGTAIGALYGGTGINTSASTGVPTLSSGTWSVASSLSIALGGTNATSVGSAGSIAYSTGSAYAFSAVGTTGQALISGGTGAPTFFAPTAGSILFAGTSGILQQDNANFFWDDTNNRLGLGTTTPASMLSIYGTSNALRLSYDASNYNTFSTASDGTLNVTSSATTEAQFIIGNSTAQDTSIAFNSDTNDFYAGVDDATDKFMIGSGFIVGTTPYVTIDATGNLGIGDTTPASLFTVGSGDLFQVNSSGAIAAATGITSSGTITFSGLSTAGIVTNTSGGVLGTTTTVPVANGGTGIDGSSAANGTLLIGNGSGYTLATLTGSNGLSITNGGGSITLALDITTTGTTVTTSSNSGLETDASGLRLLGGCSNDQVLAWNSSSNIWVCSDKTGGTSNFTDAGAFTYLTSITDDVVFGGATTDAGFFFDVSASTLAFEGLTADAFETTFGVVDPTADRTLTFPDATGTVITTGNLTDITATGTIASGTWNGTAIGALYGGTGINTSASTGVPTLSSGTWSVASSLSIALGGTNATSVGSAGSIAYSTGSAYAFSAVGTTGQALISGGTGAPTFFAPTAGSILFAGTSGILQQDNANFFWDDTNNRLGLGDATPDTLLDAMSSSAAHTYFTLGNTNAGDYNPAIRFELTENSPLFSLGIDDSDSDKFKIYAGADISGTSQFSIDTTGVTTISNLNLGAMTFDTNAGVISWIDMPVTSAAAISTVESYSAAIDGNSLLTVYAESDGAGSIQNSGVSIGNATLQAGAKFAVTQSSTSTTAGTLYNTYRSLSDTGIVTTGTDTTYGNYLTITRTGATGGTINSYGQYTLLTTDNAGAGTSTAYGTYIDTGTAGSTNADTVYGLYINTEANAGTAYGLYVDAGAGAGTEYSGIFMNGNFGIGDASPSALLTVGSGDLFQVSTAGNVSTSGQISGTDGVVTKVNAGACDDTTFTLDTNGNICIDSTNGRIYYRYGAAWHYSAQTAGFQIPNYETYSYDFASRSFDTNRPLAADDFLIPFVENFMEDGAAHGLYAKFSDVKDTMFAEEKAQIAEISLKTEANISTLAGLQASVDAQLSLAGTGLTTLLEKDALHDAQFLTNDSRFTALDTLADQIQLDINTQATKTALLETQMQTLTEQLSTLTDFYATFDLGNLVAKDILGNVDLLDGKLKAAILETGVLTIEVVDEDAPTIGTAEVLPVAVDADSDGNDDFTGLSMTDPEVVARDGQFVQVMTKAMIPMVNGSRIFTTWKGNPNGFSWIEKTKDANDDYVGFKIRLSAPITIPTKVDWLLVEQKDNFSSLAP